MLARRGEERRPAGATDLHRALEAAARIGGRALVLTDGSPTISAPPNRAGLHRIDVLSATNANRAGVLALAACGEAPGAIVSSTDDVVKPTPPAPTTFVFADTSPDTPPTR